MLGHGHRKPRVMVMWQVCDSSEHCNHYEDYAPYELYEYYDELMSLIGMLLHILTMIMTFVKARVMIQMIIINRFKRYINLLLDH